jgi:hypothetical protein
MDKITYVAFPKKNYKIIWYNTDRLISAKKKKAEKGMKLYDLIHPRYQKGKARSFVVGH